MNWFFDQLLSGKDAFLAYPVVIIAAVVCGGFGGYYLSRLRHQSIIDTQKERLAHKDDIIKFKDSAIAVEAKPEVWPASPAVPKPGKTEARFVPINETVQKGIEERLTQAVTNRRFKFVFNPLSEGSKVISFLPDGKVGEGGNKNETHWRIIDGRLEIINSEGEIYSRFFLFPDGKSLHHTNEKELPSIHGQFMTPI